MNLKENFVITIGRQFGTGGHEIGTAIAKQLNVKLIDKTNTEGVIREV